MTTPVDTPRKSLPRSYLLWLGGALTSQLGDAVLYFALGWAASVHGGVAAGLVLTSIALPRTLLLLLGGAVGDRVGARRVMIIGDAVMIGVALLLAITTTWIGAPVLLLVVAGLIVGTNDAFYLPSSGSMPRQLVEDELVGRALALRQSGSQLISVIGAPLGGVLVAFAGVPAAAWLDAVTFGIVLVVLVRVRPRFAPPPPAQRKHIAREALDGVRIAFTTAGLGPALLLVAGAAGFILPFSSILIPLLAREHAWGATGAGVLVGVQAAGTIVTTLIVSKRGVGTRAGLIAVGGLAAVGLGQFVVGLTGTMPGAVAGVLLMGLASGVFITHLNPVLLKAAPPEYLARVQALLALVQSVTLLITNNAIGTVAHAFRPETAVYGCAAVLLGCAGAGLASGAIRRITD
ncbi:MFS transporter [Amycolatopsis sp. cmx-4-54]|uniref:MFS transporter n=1 Tax=Amycolatopsis sp. cmx-4-54 TaxID=2790936 RepID=UPI00397CA020